MVRRTKEEARATRERLLDTAERVFQQRGVSRTSLGEIAAAAGVSRGAIYWHFQDKADLFNAMMTRISLPMEEQARCMASDPAPAGAPLEQVRHSLREVLRRIVDDPRVQRVFEIATHKVEYVDELRGVRERHLSVRDGCLRQVSDGLEQAMAAGLLARGVPARELAIGMYALVDGLIHNWMLDPGSFDLVAVGEQALDAYLRGLAAGPAH